MITAMTPTTDDTPHFEFSFKLFTADLKTELFEHLFKDMSELSHDQQIAIRALRAGKETWYMSEAVAWSICNLLAPITLRSVTVSDELLKTCRDFFRHVVTTVDDEEYADSFSYPWALRDFPEDRITEAKINDPISGEDTVMINLSDLIPHTDELFNDIIELQNHSASIQIPLRALKKGEKNISLSEADAMDLINGPISPIVNRQTKASEELVLACRSFYKDVYCTIDDVTPRDEIPWIWQLLYHKEDRNFSIDAKANNGICIIAMDLLNDELREELFAMPTNRAQLSTLRPDVIKNLKQLKDGAPHIRLREDLVRSLMDHLFLGIAQGKTKASQELVTVAISIFKKSMALVRDCHPDDVQIPQTNQSNIFTIIK